MAVFYNTGGGDTYAGPTKEAVIEAMQADCSDIDLDEIFEVPGDHKMNVCNENGDPTDDLVTLADEYGESSDTYIICTENL